jgi:hypothetical protein
VVVLADDDVIVHVIVWFLASSGGLVGELRVQHPISHTTRRDGDHALAYAGTPRMTGSREFATVRSAHRVKRHRAACRDPSGIA